MFTLPAASLIAYKVSRETGVEIRCTVCCREFDDILNSRISTLDYKLQCWDNACMAFGNSFVGMSVHSRLKLLQCTLT